MQTQSQSSALQELTLEVLKMGGLVEAALNFVVELMEHYQLESWQKLQLNEQEINSHHKKIDEWCVEAMAKFSPKASDLRRIFSIVKINADLERIGDQSRNCGYILKDLNTLKSNESLSELKAMLQLSKKMVQLSLDGLARQEATEMQQVLSLDDQVDRLKDQILSSSLSKMYQNNQKIEVYLHHIMLAKNIERMGDHATNIAEDIIYVCTGADIRHGGVKNE